MFTTLSHDDQQRLAVTHVYASANSTDDSILVTITEMDADSRADELAHLQWPHLHLHTTVSHLHRLADELREAADRGAVLVAERREKEEAARKIADDGTDERAGMTLGAAFQRHNATGDVA